MSLGRPNAALGLTAESSRNSHDYVHIFPGHYTRSSLINTSARSTRKRVEPYPESSGHNVPSGCWCGDSSSARRTAARFSSAWGNAGVAAHPGFVSACGGWAQSVRRRARFAAADPAGRCRRRDLRSTVPATRWRGVDRGCLRPGWTHSAKRLLTRTAIGRTWRSAIAMLLLPLPQRVGPMRSPPFFAPAKEASMNASSNPSWPRASRSLQNAHKMPSSTPARCHYWKRRWQVW